MRRVAVAIAVLSFTLASSGCITSRSYVDPTLPKVKYADLTVPGAPTPVVVSVEFSTNGEPNEKARPWVQERIVKALETSRLFSQVTVGKAGSGARLTISLDNQASKGSAAAKGFVTGLTLGLAGNSVTDEYVFKAKYESGGRPVADKVYKHAVHTMTNSSAPGLTPMTLEAAIQEVIEQLVLNLLRDLQRDGALAPPTTPRA